MNIAYSRTFWSYVTDKEAGEFHFYQLNFLDDPSIRVIPSKKFLCGKEVIDYSELGDYDWMQMMRNGYEPYEDKFCKKCMMIYKESKK
jgi:hypothetical protein